MINLNEVFETNKMIHEMNLDVRTITIGISLLDCVGATLEEVRRIFIIRSQQLQKIL